VPHATFERRARTPLPRRLLALALFAACAFAASAVSAQSLNTGSPDLVISQVYTRGGESGATFRNDFVEVFNRGNSNVNIADYTLQVLVNAPPTSGGGLTSINILFVSSNGGVPILPGEYRLYKFGSSGNNGADLPVTPDASGASDFNLPSNAGRVVLVKGRANAAFAQFGCAVGVDASIADFFSYGAATCVEGTENFPAPSPTTAAVRNVDGCADTDNNVADFTTAAPNPRASSSPARLCNMSAPAKTVQFEAASASVNEDAGFAEIFVTRTGDTSDFAYFQYATSDDSATERSDYTTTLGSFVFARGESRTSFRVPITNDVRPEGGESLTISLGAHNYPAGTAALGQRHIMKLGIADDDAGPKPNPIDTTDFFVRQHYYDFLSRVPDAPGLQFWTGEIDGCGADSQCREVKRINVSAAFFLSIEFQDSGYFAYRAYKAAFPDNASRLRGFPLYRELWYDAQEIAGGVVVGQDNWQQRLEGGKVSFTDEFVRRPEFRLRYPLSMTPAQFIDAINANTGGALSASERQREIDDLTSTGNGDGGRALVFKHILDDADFVRSEKNRAFVLMQYFGYLRRNPTDSPETTRSFDGYDFWLSKLNEFNGNFIQAEMVKGFISSDEYRHRFGQ
jgi:hypothetical protein